MKNFPETAPLESELKNWQEKGALVLRQPIPTTWLYEIDPLKPAWLFISLTVHGLLLSFLLMRF